MMKSSLNSRPAGYALVLALALGVAGCGMGDTSDMRTNEEKRKADGGRITGDSGFNIFGGAKKQDEGGGAGLGVNSFLWRASLDTFAFMPLVSADPFGGVIITDWYSAPGSPNERFKVTVYILDRALRADGVRVAVFRQVRDGAGWVDQAVEPRTPTDLENAVLTRARELRVAQSGI
jgi:hypothetical protein